MGDREGSKRVKKEGFQQGSRKHTKVMGMFSFWLCGDGFMNVHIRHNLSSCTLEIRAVYGRSIIP